MELQSVRLIQPFISLVKVLKVIDKSTGQILHISSCVEKNIGSLGRSSDNCDSFSAVHQQKGAVKILQKNIRCINFLCTMRYEF